MEPASIALIGAILSIISRLAADRLWPAALRRLRSRVKDNASAAIMTITQAGVVLPRDDTAPRRAPSSVAEPAAVEVVAHDRSSVDLHVGQAGVHLSEPQMASLNNFLSERLDVLSRESRRSFWMGVAVNFLFFVAGVGATSLIG
jgi:hypothetical protein